MVRCFELKNKKNEERRKKKKKRKKEEDGERRKPLGVAVLTVEFLMVYPWLHSVGVTVSTVEFRLIIGAIKKSFAMTDIIKCLQLSWWHIGWWKSLKTLTLTCLCWFLSEFLHPQPVDDLPGKPEVGGVSSERDVDLSCGWAKLKKLLNAQTVLASRFQWHVSQSQKRNFRFLWCFSVTIG